MLRLGLGTLGLGAAGIALVTAVAAVGSMASCSSDEFAAPPTYCAGANGTLCDDFEATYDGGFAPAWTLSVNGGSVAREAVTPGTGFALHTAYPAGTAKRNAQLVWDPNLASVRGITFSSRVKLSASCADGVAFFGFSAGAGTGGVGVAIGAGTFGAGRPLVLIIGSQQADAAATTTPVFGTDDVGLDTWLDLKFDMVFGRPLADGGGPTGGVDITVSLGGKPQIQILGAEGGNSLSSPRFAIGASTTTSMGSCDVWLDDVLFTLTK